MPFQFRKEAIEEDLNTNFPSQGQGNPPLYYSLSEVVVPTYSINNVAEGSSLPTYLQRAWDFSTGHIQITNTGSTIISNTGFWQLEVNLSYRNTGVDFIAGLNITDGLSTKVIWEVNAKSSGTYYNNIGLDNLVIFLRSGDSLTGNTNDSESFLNVSYRQVADINGNLIEPLGYSAA